MKNRWGTVIISGALAVMLMGAAVDVRAQNNNQVTQGELALMLINVMALHNEVEVPGSPLDAIRVLLLYGVAPSAGWDVDAPVVLADLAVVLVKALGAQDEVEDANDPAQCIAYLEGLGVPLDTVSGAVLIVPPRGDMPPGAEATDLDRPDTEGLQRPLSLRVVREIIVSVPVIPPRPRPVTPD